MKRACVRVCVRLNMDEQVWVREWASVVRSEWVAGEDLPGRWLVVCASLRELLCELCCVLAHVNDVYARVHVCMCVLVFLFGCVWLRLGWRRAMALSP